MDSKPTLLLAYLGPFIAKLLVVFSSFSFRYRIFSASASRYVRQRCTDYGLRSTSSDSTIHKQAAIRRLQVMEHFRRPMLNLNCEFRRNFARPFLEKNRLRKFPASTEPQAEVINFTVIGKITDFCLILDCWRDNSVISGSS